MMWNWSGFQTVADLPTSAIPGRTRSTMLPGGDGPAGRAVSLIVYWVLAVPIGTRHPDLAWSFLRHVATPAMDRVTALAGGSGVRFSTWNDSEVRGRFGYYAVLEEVHRHVRTLPRLPQWQTIAGVLDRMMAAVVTGGVAVPEALRSAREEVEDVLGGRMS
jgi:ABC-type glycerol-3-phosphate transport system substrate-binding protein